MSPKNRKANSFFEEKLFVIESGSQSKTANNVPPGTDRSFLVLFFKKELFTFPSFQWVDLLRPDSPILKKGRTYISLPGHNRLSLQRVGGIRG
jgi:hypothetical protein